MTTTNPVPFTSERACPYCGAKGTTVVIDAADHAAGTGQAECTNCAARGPVYDHDLDAMIGWERSIIY